MAIPLKKFIRTYGVHVFFSELILLYPVFMLLFKTKGLSVLEMSLLLTIWSLTTVIFEIPSGVLADRLGRKRVIVAGTCFKLICFSLWLFAESFTLFAVGFVFWGLQQACCSGSTEALLYDTLKKHGQESEYERISGRAGFYAGIAVTLSMILGGYAAAVSFQAVTIASIAAVFLSAVAALRLEEARMPAAEAPPCSFAIMAKGTLAQISHKRSVMMLMAICSLVLVVPGMLEEYDQLFVEDIGLSYQFIGLWGALRTGMESLGSRFAYKLKAAFQRMRRILVLTIIGGVALAISASGHVYLLPVYALFYFINSVGYVLTESALQRSIPSDTRATLLSVNSLFYNLSGIVYNIVFAWVSDAFGLRTGFLCIAIYAVLASLVFFIVSGRAQQEPLAD